MGDCSWRWWRRRRGAHTSQTSSPSPSSSPLLLAIRRPCLAARCIFSIIVVLLLASANGQDDVESAAAAVADTTEIIGGYNSTLTNTDLKPRPQKEDCSFAFFPDTVKTQVGDRMMTARLVGDVLTHFVESPLNAHRQWRYTMVVRLQKPINPRLCRFLITRNDGRSTYYYPSSIGRKPMIEENGMPKIHCMLNEYTVGPPVVFMPRFSRAGALIPLDNRAIREPLCGDMFFFKQYTLLKLSGVVEYGFVQILECQSGELIDQHDYVDFSLFQANCTNSLPRRPYIEGGYKP